MQDCLKIASDLKFEIWYEGERVTDTVLKSIMSVEYNTCTVIKNVFDFLESNRPIEFSDEEVIETIISKLMDPRFDGNAKVAFIAEQLSLVFKVPTRRRYSPSLLAFASTWERISPACYKQILHDGFLTLPSTLHLRRLSSSSDINSLELGASTVAYLTARFKKLCEKDKLVSVLMDEVYSHQDVQYVNGQFYGAENGDLTKTLLCVMLKSIAGKYRDIVAMVPIVNISADKLFSVWKNVVTKVSEIGFDIAVTMADGHSANMKLFNNKILTGSGNLSIPNLDFPGSYIFPMYDPSHIFKMFYNNWMVKQLFRCPSMDGSKIFNPSFSQLKELHEIEKGKGTKMAYRITEKVLHPQSIEKTSVKLADSIFHESTINALLYYSEHGYDDFVETAHFLRYIRNWFNKINVKSTDYGIRSRDDNRNPIRRESVENDVVSISEFCSWCEAGKGLSQQTFKAAIRTCKAMIELVKYLFTRYPNLEFILLGNISSDYLEERFGWYRQLCGAKYYNSVYQFLQAEKSIRVHSLVKMGYDMNQITSTFKPVETKRSAEQAEEIKAFQTDLEHFDFGDIDNLDDSEKAIIYYIAGYIAKFLSNSKCTSCITLITAGRQELQMCFENESEETDKETLDAKQEFLSIVSKWWTSKTVRFCLYFISPGFHTKSFYFPR